MVAEEIFELRTHFYLGNFAQCIAEAEKVKPASEAQRLEIEAFSLRSQVALGQYKEAAQKIKPGAPAAFQHIKLLARYLAGDRKGAMGELEERQRDNVDMSDHITPLITATIYSREGDVESALRCLHQSDNLECVALQVALLLSIDRLDKARGDLKRMQQLDEDDTLTQLASAWIALSTGGEKLQEAYYILQELADKYGSSALVLNALASSLLGQKKLDDVESLLSEARDLDPANVETKHNLALLGKEESPMLQKLANKEAEFDRLVLQYRPT